MSRPSVLLYCTADRFNYGDLLFPVITSSFLDNINQNFRIATYGVIARDMRPYGGAEVKSVASLLQDATPGSTVLVAGGEILAQSWLDTYLTLVSPSEVDPLLQRAAREGVDSVDLHCRDLLGCKHRLPLVLAPNDFDIPVNIAYHSVGGWPLRHAEPGLRRHVADSLSKARFVSLRDRETVRCLRASDTRWPFSISPDVASVISEVWPRERLSELVSPSVARWTAMVGDYLCFQCNPHVGNCSQTQIAHQLTALHRRTGLPILLLPLAQMTGNDDRSLLRTLDLRPWLHYLEEAETIHDLAYLIASSALFAGTSLHGVITAVSYEVPFLGLATSDPKLGYYHESWLPGFATVPVEALAVTALQRMQHPRASYERLSLRLRHIARNTLTRLAQTL